MTGYQEVLTDPSYRGQIVTMTAPEIGNVGVNAEDAEIGAPMVRGVRRARASARVLELAGEETLEAYAARRHGVVGIAGVDTRALTRRLRDGGAAEPRSSAPDRSRDGELVEQAREHPSLHGRDLVREVTPAPLRLGPRRMLARPREIGAREADASGAPRRRHRLRHQAQHPALPASMRAAGVTVVPGGDHGRGGPGH